MRAAGDNCAIIAKVLGTSSRAVFKKAWRERWPRAARLKIWTPEAVETAKRMWAAGDSSTVIAKALGVSGQSVLVKARREGWPRPVGDQGPRWGIPGCFGRDRNVGPVRSRIAVAALTVADSEAFGFPAMGRRARQDDALAKMVLNEDQVLRWDDALDPLRGAGIC
jgi:hypothetical protein